MSEPSAADKTTKTYLILKYLSGFWVNQATQKKFSKNLTGAKSMSLPACS